MIIKTLMFSAIIALGLSFEHETALAQTDSTIGSGGSLPMNHDNRVTWDDVRDKPITATRWPRYSEVTNKPSYATRWPRYSEITNKPSYASRWPTFNEVTGKPSNYPTKWNSISGKPSSFPSQWGSIAGKPSNYPTKWSDISGRPSSFKPSSHNHDGRYLRSTGGTLSGNLTMGGNRITSVDRITANSFYYSSDKNRKRDIETIDNGLDFIGDIRGVTYTWKESGEKDMGIIAQEIESVFPYLVENDLDENGRPYKTVKITSLVGLLIESVKTLKEENELLNNRVKTLENSL